MRQQRVGWELQDAFSTPQQSLAALGWGPELLAGATRLSYSC